MRKYTLCDSVVDSVTAVGFKVGLAFCATIGIFAIGGLVCLMCGGEIPPQIVEITGGASLVAILTVLVSVAVRGFYWFVFVK